jgi:PPK2 family polyphosphate:nucleotide phosphotransferase
MMDVEKYLVKPGKSYNIQDFPTSIDIEKPDKKQLNEILDDDIQGIADLQYKLYAEDRQSLLIVLQGMDSSGKDSTIKHIMSGVNPQGVKVYSFKHPAGEELEHDYLWRHYLKLPQRGEIVVFNRSHYENVLITKVHPEIVLTEKIPGIDSVDKVDKEFWERRYKQINHFEETISYSGIHILKFMLHLSKEEQRERFLKRIDKRDKHWKFSFDDIKEREFWDEYQKAYEDAINHTSTDIAPWYVVPADKKWYTHLIIGKVLLDKLKQINPTFPSITKTDQELMDKAKEKLLNE